MPCIAPTRVGHPMGDALPKAANSITLWGVGTPRTLRVHWALAELGLAYDTRPIVPRSAAARSPAFTGLTARQKVPVLQDGDFVLTESAAIVIYLSDTYSEPGAALVPCGGRERAVCLEWCFFALTELDAASLYVIRRHGGLPETYGEAPAAIEAARRYFQAQMRSVDRQLSDGRPFVLGERFSAADVMLGTCLDWAVRWNVEVSDTAANYLTAISTRPAFQQARSCNAARA